MLNIFKKAPKPPKPSAENPGLGSTANVGFSNNERSWEESADLVEILAEVLLEKGFECDQHKHWLQFGKLQFQPQVVSLAPLDDGGVQTASTIEVSHPEVIPGGLFEYQHATGDNTAESFRNGFSSWVESDFPAFFDLDRDEPRICTMLSVDFPETQNAKRLSRRILLAPPAHYAENPADSGEEHPFCACCLVTNNYESFEDLISADTVHGVRLFVLRDQSGSAQADCRVDGIEHDAGEHALKNYAETWPQRGYEYRKQYVLVHTVASDATIE